MTTTADTDRKLVLEMLANGKIGVEDAQRLLSKLEDVENSPEQNGGFDGPAKPRPRHLRIVATDGHAQEEINLRIPLGLVRAGLALNTFLPSWAQSRIIVGSDFSDMTKLDIDFLRENLDDLDLTFDSEDGESVHIFSE